MRDLHNCTHMVNSSLECYKFLVAMLNSANNDIWSQYRNSKENKLGADIYTVVILGLFASVIVCLLFRSVKKSESADDQVMLLLSSMQIHVDFEERQRQRRKMREEKTKTQSFISDITMRKLRKFTRSRSASTHVMKERSSICSVPNPRPYSPFTKSPYRTSSYQGYLPEIVVTDHHQQQQKNNNILVPTSQPMTPLSRQSSMTSNQSNFNDNCSVFMYPDDVDYP